MLVETELGNANEREAKPKLNLYNEKGDLEGFQRDFKTFFFTCICHTLTPVN